MIYSIYKRNLAGFLEDGTQLSSFMRNRQIFSTMKTTLFYDLFINKI